MTATVHSLADHRAQKAKAGGDTPANAASPPKPARHRWAEDELHLLSERLVSLAMVVTVSGELPPPTIGSYILRVAQAAEGLADQVQEIRDRMSRAERRLRPMFPGLKGADLVYAIRYGRPPKRRKER